MNETKQFEVETMAEEDRDKVATYQLLQDVYKTKYSGKYKDLISGLEHMNGTIGMEAMLFILMDEVRNLKR